LQRQWIDRPPDIVSSDDFEAVNLTRFQIDFHERCLRCVAEGEVHIAACA